MKQSMRQSYLVLLLGAMLIISSCKKVDSSNVVTPTTTAFQNMTESEKVGTIQDDADWKIVASNNDKVIQKFMSKNIDMSTFDFKDEAAFLKVIDMNKSDYLTEAVNNKNAATRLMIKYNLSQYSTVCTTCKVTEQDKIASTRSMLKDFQLHPDNLSKFKERSLGIFNPSSRNKTGLDLAQTRCCPVAFYGCVVVCAATIAAFPVYLICCGGCYLGTCCS